MEIEKLENPAPSLYYFRGTTLQTDDIPIIQYLAYDNEGHLMEKVDIFHDGRCHYHAADGGILPEATVVVSEVASNWSYGDAAVCTMEEFVAMKQLALTLAAQKTEAKLSSKNETRLF